MKRVRTRKKIPFSPSFGKKPKIFIGREGISDKILDSLYEDNGIYRTSVITGLRGMGKTALLSEIESELRSEQDWIVVSTSTTEHLLSNVIGNLQLEIAEKQSTIPKLSAISFSVLGLGFKLEMQEKVQASNFQTIMKKCIAELTKAGIGVLFTIDEVSNTSEMKEFAATYQLLLREDFDVALLMAGLPHNVNELISDDVLTFLRRASIIHLEGIELTTIKTAYQRVFEGEEIDLEGDSLELLSVTTKGYPYLFQLLGSELWQLNQKVISENDVRIASINGKNKMYSSVHSLIYRELSDADQQFLMAMAEDVAETKIIDIRKRMEKSSGFISKYRERLMTIGIIESKKYGTVQFVLPYMRDYLLEKKKELRISNEL